MKKIFLVCFFSILCLFFFKGNVLAWTVSGVQNAWTNSNVAVYPVDAYYAINGNYRDHQNGAAPFTLTDSGVYNIEFTQYGTYALSYTTIMIDKLAPSVPSISDGGAFSYISALTFNWSASADTHSGMANYYIEIATNPGFSNVVFYGYTGNTTSYTWNQALDSTTYYARVSAVDSVGNFSSPSLPSDGITVYTLARIGLNPTQLPSGYTSEYSPVTNFITITNPANNVQISFVSSNVVTQVDMSNINLKEVSNGDYRLIISSSSALGVLVNSGQVTFNVMFPIVGGKTPIIYINDGSGSKQALALNGQVLPAWTNYIQDVAITPTQISFTVKHLTEYSIGYVDRLVFEPMKVTGNTGASLKFKVRVLSTFGDVLSNAPVTFNFVTNPSNLSSFTSATSLLTDAQGYASVTVNFGASDVLISAVTDGTYAYAHGSHEAVPFTGLSVTPYTTTVNYDANSPVSTGNGLALTVPIMHIYGVSVNPLATSTQNIWPTHNYYFVHKIMNKGNLSDVFTFAPIAAPTNWVAEVVTLNSDAAPAVTTLTLAKGTSRNVYIRVSPPDVAGTGPFVVGIKFNTSTSYADGAEYQGNDPDSSVTKFGALDSQITTDNAWAIDAVAPSLSVISPMPNSVNVSVATKLYFTVFDVQSGVSANSIVVSVKNNGLENIYTAALEKATPDGEFTYAVTLNPLANFGYGSQVRVTFNAEDKWLGGPNSPNVLAYAFTFNTISGPDLVVTRIIEGLVTPNGSLNALVPGARIKYLDQIYNQGGSQAVSENIEVPIPTNTTFYQVGTGDHTAIDYRSRLSDMVGAFTTSADVKALIFKIDTHDGSSTKNIRYEVTVD